MPFLDVVHVRERRCATCNALLAEPGSRSFIVDSAGDPVNFSESDPPSEMRVGIVCESGHRNEFAVPQDLSAEAAMMTPEEAPIASDALLIESKP